MRRVALAALSCSLLLTAGCAGGEPDPAGAPPNEPERPLATAAPAADPTCPVGDTRLGSGEIAFGAVVTRVTAAVRRPGGSVITRLGRMNVNGVPTVLGVLGVRRNASCAPTWYRVQLPVRPNGTVGWVRASDVRLRRVTTRILVDLSDRHVTLFRAGKPVLDTQAAIGKPATPTPTGRFYVNQRLVAPDPSGPFGPGAVGISAFSPTLQHWTQGGPIAIHGTNTPTRLGEAVSYGCVRIANAALLELYALAAEGTPVVIRA